MCIEPLDTSECTRAMPRGASVDDEDGYAGIARARRETPAAWTHLPAKRRSDIDVGGSEGTRASDGRTPVPATPASPKRADRLIPLASAPKTVGAASNGVAARKPGKKRGRGKRSVAEGKPTKDIDARIGRPPPHRRRPEGRTADRRDGHGRHALALAGGYRHRVRSLRRR